MCADLIAHVEVNSSTQQRRSRIRLNAEQAAIATSLPMAAWVASNALWRSEDGTLRLALFDDAMISMSYARTFAEGKGLVWYPGADRVEGYSNPLWTLFMAAVHRTGLPTFAVITTVILCSLATVWAGSIISSRIAREHFGVQLWPSRFAVTFCVAGSLPLLFWAGRGMEVGLLVLTTLALVHSVLRARETLSRTRLVLIVATTAVGMLTRADFIVVVAAVITWLLATKGSRHLLLPIAAVTVACLIAVTGFRLVYYDAWMPNTYYLKLTEIPLSTRLSRGLEVDAVSGFSYLLALLLLLVAVRRAGDDRGDAAKLLGLIAGAQVLYSTYTGGDAWEEYLIPNRYLTLAVVCLAIVVMASLASLLERKTTRGWRAIIVPLAASLAVVGPIAISDAADRSALIAGLGSILLGAVGMWSWRRHGKQAIAVVVSGATVLGSWAGAPNIPTGHGAGTAQLGEQLARISSVDTTIAVVAAGGTQYYSRRPAIDLLGKMDPVVARGPVRAELPFKPGHSKWDYQHSIGELRPDIVAQLYPPTDPVAYRVLTERGYVMAELRDGQFKDALPWPNTEVILVRPGADVDWTHLRKIGR